MACRLAFSEHALNSVHSKRSPTKYPFPSSSSSVSTLPKVVLLPSSVLQSRTNRQEQSDISIHTKATAPHPKNLKSPKASEPCMPATSSIAEAPPIITTPDLCPKPLPASQEGIQGRKSLVLGCLRDPHHCIGASLARSSPQDNQSSAQPVRKKVRFSGRSSPEKDSTVVGPWSGPEEDGGLSGRNADELDRRKDVHERGSSQLEPVIVTVHFTHSRQAYDRSPIPVDRVFNMSLNLPPRSRTSEVTESGPWLTESDEAFEHTESHAQATAGLCDRHENSALSQSLQSGQPLVFKPAERNVLFSRSVLLPDGGFKERVTRTQNRSDNSSKASDHCTAINPRDRQGQSLRSPRSASPSQGALLANATRTHCSTEEISLDSKSLSDDKDLTREVDQKDSELISAQEGLCGLGNWRSSDVYGSCDALDGF